MFRKSFDQNVLENVEEQLSIRVYTYMAIGLHTQLAFMHTQLGFMHMRSCS